MNGFFFHEMIAHCTKMAFPMPCQSLRHRISTHTHRDVVHIRWIPVCNHCDCENFPKINKTRFQFLSIDSRHTRYAFSQSNTKNWSPAIKIDHTHIGTSAMHHHSVSFYWSIIYIYWICARVLFCIAYMMMIIMLFMQPNHHQSSALDLA